MQDADLFEPVLDERHDLVGFGRPWNPWRVVFATFFGGPLCGAYLIGRNELKLGRRGVAIAVASFFVLLAGGLTVYAHANGFYRVEGEGRSEAYRDFKLTMRLLTVVPAAALAVWQMRRFRIFHFSDDEEAPFVLEAIAAVVVGQAVLIGLWTWLGG